MLSCEYVFSLEEGSFHHAYNWRFDRLLPLPRCSGPHPFRHWRGAKGPVGRRATWGAFVLVGIGMPPVCIPLVRMDANSLISWLHIVHMAVSRD